MPHGERQAGRLLINRVYVSSHHHMYTYIVGGGGIRTMLLFSDITVLVQSRLYPKKASHRNPQLIIVPTEIALPLQWAGRVGQIDSTHLGNYAWCVCLSVVLYGRESIQPAIRLRWYDVQYETQPASDKSACCDDNFHSSSGTEKVIYNIVFLRGLL